MTKDQKSDITIKIRRTTKERLEKGRLDHIKKHNKIISLAEYIDLLSKIK